jgi:hypothetical protein
MINGSAPTRGIGRREFGICEDDGYESETDRLEMEQSARVALNRSPVFAALVQRGAFGTCADHVFSMRRTYDSSKSMRTYINFAGPTFEATNTHAHSDRIISSRTS